jgi:hypothetical protein
MLVCVYHGMHWYVRVHMTWQAGPGPGWLCQPDISTSLLPARVQSASGHRTVLLRLMED